MLPLDKDLRIKKESLDEFKAITIRVLDYLPNIVSSYKEKGEYRIYTSVIAGTTKYLRPINRNRFIADSSKFQSDYVSFRKLFPRLGKNDSHWEEYEKDLIDNVVYTMQQSIGAGFDLLVNPNSARKHVGNRFEELIKCVFNEIGISNKRTVLKIPYETENGQKDYRCENDLILSPFSTVKSTNKHLDENEVVVSVKTTSKDRMGKMFIDKILLERFVGHKQKVIGIFLNDVQRKESDNISYTLVSGLFMVYSKFLVQLDGVYYLDPPPNVFKEPYSNHMGTFGTLLTNDIWKLLVTP